MQTEALELSCSHLACSFDSIVGLSVPPQAQLRASLADLVRKGRYALLLVDKAHPLPPQLFDQLRFPLNDEMDSASLLTLVLLGQPDLAHKLRFTSPSPATITGRRGENRPYVKKTVRSPSLVGW